jgi:hypothetical protein
MAFADYSLFTVVQEHMTAYEAKDETGGEYDDAGVFVPVAADWQEYEGSIVPLSAEQLQTDAIGAYSLQDRNLFTFTPHKIGAFVRYRGETYKIHSEREYPEYVQNSDLSDFDGEGDLRVYLLKAEGRAQSGGATIP